MSLRASLQEALSCSVTTTVRGITIMLLKQRQSTRSQLATKSVQIQESQLSFCRPTPVSCEIQRIWGLNPNFHAAGVNTLSTVVTMPELNKGTRKK